MEANKNFQHDIDGPKPTDKTSEEETENSTVNLEQKTEGDCGILQSAIHTSQEVCEQQDTIIDMSFLEEFESGPPMAATESDEISGAGVNLNGEARHPEENLKDGHNGLQIQEGEANVKDLGEHIILADEHNRSASNSESSDSSVVTVIFVPKSEQSSPTKAAIVTEADSNNLDVDDIIEVQEVENAVDPITLPHEEAESVEKIRNLERRMMFLQDSISGNAEEESCTKCARGCDCKFTRVQDEYYNLATPNEWKKNFCIWFCRILCPLLIFLFVLIFVYVVGN